jgi:hypothetical protein
VAEGKEGMVTSSASPSGADVSKAAPNLVDKQGTPHLHSAEAALAPLHLMLPSSTAAAMRPATQTSTARSLAADSAAGRAPHSVSPSTGMSSGSMTSLYITHRDASTVGAPRGAAGLQGAEDALDDALDGLRSNGKLLFGKCVAQEHVRLPLATFAGVSIALQVLQMFLLLSLNWV